MVNRIVTFLFFFSFLTGPVCVVTVAGPYRMGKSYILSEAFNQPEVFPLGHEMVAETMGIWLWIVPEKYKVSDRKLWSCLLPRCGETIHMEMHDSANICSFQ